jgi:group I intron endonuclease
MEEKIYCIYKHTSPSGKAYIGLTNNYERRCKEHLRKRKNSAFYGAINKYGWDSFTHEFLATGLSIQAANHFEEFYIDFYNSMSPNGYNLTTGGGNTKLSEESRLKMSKSLKGRKCTEEQNERNRQAQLGKKASEETKLKMSISMKGKKHTPEAILKMKAHKKSPEHIEKVRLANLGIDRGGTGKGRIISEETRAKISKTLTGRKHTEESKAKMSIAFTGRKLTDIQKKENSIRQYGFKFDAELKLYNDNVTVLDNSYIFTVAELSKVLGVDRKTINDRVNKGYYPNKYEDLNRKRKILIPIIDVHTYYELGEFRYG